MSLGAEALAYCNTLEEQVLKVFLLKGSLEEWEHHEAIEIP